MGVTCDACQQPVECHVTSYGRLQITAGATTCIACSSILCYDPAANTPARSCMLKCQTCPVLLCQFCYKAAEDHGIVLWNRMIASGRWQCLQCQREQRALRRRSATAEFISCDVFTDVVSTRPDLGAASPTSLTNAIPELQTTLYDALFDRMPAYSVQSACGLRVPCGL